MDCITRLHERNILFFKHVPQCYIVSQKTDYFLPDVHIYLQKYPINRLMYTIFYNHSSAVFTDKIFLFKLDVLKCLFIEGKCCIKYKMYYVVFKLFLNNEVMCCLINFSSIYRFNLIKLIL